MAKSDDIQVISYDGHRARVRPRAVIFEGQRLEVKEIEDSSISTGIELKSPVQYRFVVRCYGGARFKLIYVDRDGWQAEMLPSLRLID